MKASFATILLTLTFSHFAFAHGANKAGPHGGYIRMPGNYHIELVPAENKEIKVYFLDMTFAPVSLEEAQVTMTLKGKKTLKAECLKEQHFFRCDTKDQSFKNYREVIVESSRDGKGLTSSVYKIPLSFQ
jgi:hypothetical protein